MKKIFLILVLVGFACQDPTYLEDGQGVAIKIPTLWHARSFDDTGVGPGFMQGRIVHNDHRLFLSRRNKQNYLTMRHIETGKVLWEWKDFAQAQGEMPTQERVPLHSPQYQWDNILLIVDNWGNRYFIDLTTGQTFSKGRFKIGYSFSFGIDNQFFLIHAHRNSDLTEEDHIYTGKMLSHETKLFFKPDYDREVKTNLNGVGRISRVKGFKGSTGDRYAAVFFIDPAKRPGNTTRFADNVQYMALYNLSQERWIYRRQEVHRYGSISIEPVVVGDKIYVAGTPFVVCIDLKTGTVLWKKDFYNQFKTLGFYGLAVADGLVLANSSHDPFRNSAILYAFDAETGAEVWRTKSSGTSSRLVTLNGVAYFVGGGDGLLHAVEIASGKHLWRIESPDLKHNSGAWFQSEITAVPGKNGKRGIILTSSYLSAMAFEAAR